MYYHQIEIHLSKLSRIYYLQELLSEREESSWCFTKQIFKKACCSIYDAIKIVVERDYFRNEVFPSTTKQPETNLSLPVKPFQNESVTSKIFIYFFIYNR